MRGREETERERSMVDFRAETASSSDKTEFTETEDQRRTHHPSSSGEHRVEEVELRGRHGGGKRVRSVSM